MSKKADRNRAARKLHRLCNCVIATVSGLVFEAPAHGLTINLSYDPSVTALSYAASVESATSYAAQQIENLFSDNITINIEVLASTNTFGQSGHSYNYPYSYAMVRSDLIASATTSTDATAYATLPSSPDPTGGGSFGLATVEEKALGLIPGNSTGIDGLFTFGSNVDWTFDPNNRAVPGEFDFIGVAEHEITEDMGRSTALGELSPGLYAPEDLFRYSAQACAVLTQLKAVPISRSMAASPTSWITRPPLRTTATGQAALRIPSTQGLLGARKTI